MGAGSVISRLLRGEGIEQLPRLGRFGAIGELGDHHVEPGARRPVRLGCDVILGQVEEFFGIFRSGHPGGRFRAGGGACGGIRRCFAGC